jgi:hypothetical protein
MFSFLHRDSDIIQTILAHLKRDRQPAKNPWQRFRNA